MSVMMVSVLVMFIATRPGESVKDEVSMLVSGYQFKGSTEATVTVGAASFAMLGASLKAPPKLKRAPRTPTSFRRCNSASLTLSSTMATPRYLPLGAAFITS